MGNKFMKYESGVTRQLKLNKIRTIKMQKATNSSMIDSNNIIKKSKLTLPVAFFIQTFIVKSLAYISFIKCSNILFFNLFNNSGAEYLPTTMQSEINM